MLEIKKTNVIKMRNTFSEAIKKSMILKMDHEKPSKQKYRNEERGRERETISNKMG